MTWFAKLRSLLVGASKYEEIGAQHVNGCGLVFDRDRLKVIDDEFTHCPRCDRDVPHSDFVAVLRRKS